MRGGRKPPEWEVPPRRRKMKQVYREKRDVTSFYVCNLPSICSPDVLGKVFEQFGKLADVYVAGRKDRSRTDLVAILVNLASYVKEDEKQVQSKPTSFSHNLPSPFNIQKTFCSPLGGSFADAVKAGGSPEKPERTFKFNPEDSVASRHWAVSSVIGRVVDFDKLCNLTNLFSDEGRCRPIIKFVGGLFVLISFPALKPMNDFLGQSDVLKSWFSRIEPWKGQSIPFERIACVRIHGVPITLWDKDTFDSLASGYGRVLQHSKADLYDSNLSADHLIILVNSAFKISEQFSLAWNNKSFKCWIIEEEFVWVPDFLKNKSEGFFGSSECFGDDNGSKSDGKSKSSDEASDDLSGDLGDPLIPVEIPAVTVSPCSISEDLEEGEINDNDDLRDMEDDSSSSLHEEHLIKAGTSKKNRVFGACQFNPGYSFTRPKSKPFLTHPSLDFSMVGDIGCLFSPPKFSSIQENLLNDPLVLSHVIPGEQVEISTPPITYSDFADALPTTNDPIVDVLDNSSLVNNHLVPEVLVDPPIAITVTGNDISMVNPEIVSTVLMGAELGVSLDNFMGLVKETIEGEESFLVAQ
ncbi:hypothetical protein QVD17_30123 [Tagetes erecta]|uniref:RRM domain-containing protein n=1 Tax=Tagetes erecta TaxID=13708 RepID=A0AAD8NLY8_TARER|nr:hypothetical protein QVD17_30123 [Tagetes erecta]